MTTKTAPQIGDVFHATFKSQNLELAAEAKAAGTVKALVSAYGVKYRIGWSTWHTIEAGAFAKSIAEQAAIPLFWQHAWSYTEQMPIGHGTATEEARGLVIEGEEYVDDPEVARLHRAQMAGAINEWSIGYRVLAMRADPDDDTHYYVTEGELLEASSVLRGANPATETLQVAGALLRGGFVPAGPATAGEGVPPAVLTPDPAAAVYPDGVNVDTTPPASAANHPLTDTELAARFERPELRAILATRGNPDTNT